MEELPPAVAVAAAGFVGGIVLGLAARLGRFCTLAAIEDAMFAGNYLRLRMWALALAIAMAGVAIIFNTGLIDITSSLYFRQVFNPLAWILGGVMFGIGMAFCGTCGFGILVRVGGGDLRALFTFLVLAIFAYMAIAGPTAEFRHSVLDWFALDDSSELSRTFPQVFSHYAGLSYALPFLFALALLGWSLSNRFFRRSGKHLFWAVAVGSSILFGWWATGWLGADPFEPQPVASYSFSVPLGQTLIYVMTMSSTTVNFGIGATMGVIVGAFFGALIRKEFRWETADDVRETRRHLLGAFLMGTGGVYAGGCTVGQGLTAASILTISAPLVMLSIWCGVWIGLTMIMEGSVARALRALVMRPN